MWGDGNYCERNGAIEFNPKVSIINYSKVHTHFPFRGKDVNCYIWSGMKLRTKILFYLNLIFARFNEDCRGELGCEFQALFPWGILPYRRLYWLWSKSFNNYFCPNFMFFTSSFTSPLKSFSRGVKLILPSLSLWLGPLCSAFLMY